MGSSSWLRSLGVLSVMAFEFVIITLLGAGLGYWGMEHWGWPDEAALLAILVAVALAFYRLIHVAKKAWDKNTD